MKNSLLKKKISRIKLLQNETFISILFSLVCLISIFPMLAPISITLLTLNLIFFHKHQIVSVSVLAISMIICIYGLFVFKPEIERKYKEVTKPGYHQNCKENSIENLNYYNKKIVKYKRLFGCLPYSLNDLQNEKMNIFFFPDMSYIVSNDNEGVKYASYYYEKKDSTRYYLLGVGRDGIPKTSDDILPSIFTEEKEKTGLIKFTIRKDSIKPLENKTNLILN